MHGSVREARVKAAAARQTAGELATHTAAHIRNNPVRSAGIALATGAVLGSIVGFAFGWFERSRT
jgi:ElaB/YqjD/DUF883 family membrane-anchored ribosome-binding protein